MADRITDAEWADLGRPPVEEAFVRPHTLSSPLIDAPMPSAQGDGDPGDASTLPTADLEFFVEIVIPDMPATPREGYLCCNAPDPIGGLCSDCPYGFFTTDRDTGDESLGG